MAEMCVAMICACLPAIRVLLSRRLPLIFGQTEVSTSGYSDKGDSRRKYSLSSQPQSALREVKDGQFQNKQVLRTSDNMFLAERDRGYSTKIRNPPKNFVNQDYDLNSDEQGLVPSITAIGGGNLRPQDSSSSEALGYEGLQTSHEAHDFTGKAGIPMEMVAEWKFKDEEIRVTDTLSIRSERMDLQ
jgi:hypothetical protein